MARGAAIARVAALAALAPRVALACPGCIGNHRLQSVLNLVGVMLLVPFFVALAVAWAIRRARIEP